MLDMIFCLIAVHVKNRGLFHSKVCWGSTVLLEMLVEIAIEKRESGSWD